MAPGCCYQFRPGGGDKPTYNSAPIYDFQRSLSFAAIRSSFDKMLVEMDQNIAIALHQGPYTTFRNINMEICTSLQQRGCQQDWPDSI
jgi:hypothetical protein